MKQISLANFRPIRVIHILIFVLILERNNSEIVIGGLFNETGDELNNVQELTFKFAANRAAELIRSDNNGIDFNFNVQTKEYQPDRNSSLAFENTCELISIGAAGIFGPQYGDSYRIVQAICDAKEIPNIQTRWNPRQKNGSCSINLYPHPHNLAKVFPDIVQKWEWNHYLILYENSESLIRMKLLLEHQYNSKIVVKLQHLIQDKDLGYRPLLREIKKSKENNIVLDCSIEILPEILRQAQQIGLMRSDHSFLITNLDFQTLDLRHYQYGDVNITGIRFYNPQNENIVNAVDGLNAYIQDRFRYKKYKLQTILKETFPLEAALIYDAVFLYAKAVTAILDEDSKKVIPMECDSESSWKHGYSIINSMKLSELSGLTGEIKFDNEGFRSEFTLDIIELTQNGIIQVGKWSTNDGISIDRMPIVETNETIKTLKNKKLTMVITLKPPFAMRKKSFEPLSGNDQYEGFCVDLITEISKMNDNFIVNLIIAPEEKVGTREAVNSPSWNGMMGYILRGDADLACADITINTEREEVVDITYPFMDLGIAILYKKPSSQSPGFFSFLTPFHTEVWILVIIAYVTVSLLFFIMARISPQEWRSSHPCIRNPDKLKNQFTLSNSFWFTIGALMQQGSEIAPVSISIRIAAGVWWFFALIMVSCYTANLAAFLSVKIPSEDFTNVEELYKNPEVEYGLLKNGATETFFKSSTKPLYQNMYKYMNENAEYVMTTSYDEGVERAKDPNRKYAFLMESSQIEYEIERHCTLTQVGKTIDSKGYGIAMKKGSWYLDPFSQNILKMQEEGVLDDLKRRWWKEKYTVPCGKEKPEEDETLGMLNLGGVFVVLGAGILLAAIVAIFEHFFYVWSVPRKKHTALKRSLKLKLSRRRREPVQYIGGKDGSRNNHININI